MLHLGLVEEHHDELFAARLVVDDQRLVFNIRPEAATVDFHRCLFKRKIKKLEEKINKRLICRVRVKKVTTEIRHLVTQDHPQWR